MVRASVCSGVQAIPVFQPLANLRDTPPPEGLSWSRPPPPRRAQRRHLQHGREDGDYDDQRRGFDDGHKRLSAISQHSQGSAVVPLRHSFLQPARGLIPMPHRMQERRCSQGVTETHAARTGVIGKTSTGDLTDAAPMVSQISNLVLQPSPGWFSVRGRRSIKKSYQNQNSEMVNLLDDEPSGEGGSPEFRLRCMRALQARVVAPNSLKRLLWDLLGCFFILYDVAVIPLQMFGLQESVGSVVMQWCARTFWTLDMPSTLMTGLMLPDGVICMSLEQIAIRYARGWLLLDTFVVSVDWLEVFMSGIGNSAGAARMGKTMRILRMLRLIRLLRMAKLPMIAGTILESCIRSERVLLIASMVKIMCLIATLMHFIACIWWGIGTTDSDSPSWVKSAALEHQDFAYQYATSFHWSLTQFTGTMEVYPVNLNERVYAIVVLLFAFVVSAAFISTFTSSMTRLQMISGSKNEMFAPLRRYLGDNEISRKLTLRIQRNAHHSWSEFQKALPESDIELLKLVSEPLRVELHYELYKPVLTLNPFMCRYEHENSAAVRRICHSAVGTSFLASGDVLFVQGEQPQVAQMYFVLRGALEYRRESRGDMYHATAEKGSWICEPVLWCDWTHCGLLRADADTQLLLLDSQQFQSIALHVENDCFDVSRYAIEMCRLFRVRVWGLREVAGRKPGAGVVRIRGRRGARKARSWSRCVKHRFWRQRPFLRSRAGLAELGQSGSGHSSPTKHQVPSNSEHIFGQDSARPPLRTLRAGGRTPLHGSTLPSPTGCSMNSWRRARSRT